jgi:hypothetical protein
MAERREPNDRAEHLASEARRLGVTFLMTELQTAFALLDVIEASTDAAANERRLGLVSEAYETVVARLKRTSDKTVVLTDAERDEITQLRDQVRDRLEREKARRQG